MSATSSLPAQRSFSKDMRLDRWMVRADGVAQREVFVPGPAIPLGWADWHESMWETVWTWTTTVKLDFVPAHAELDIGAVLGSIDVSVNGSHAGARESGFLPCIIDVASSLRVGTNTIEIVEDARWRPVPPMGSPLGAEDVDFFLPAGMHRPVTLRVGDVAPLRGVTVRPTGLLTDDPAVLVTVPLPADLPPGTVASVRLLREGADDLLAEVRAPLAGGQAEASFTLRPGPALALWSPQDPVLYRIATRVELDGRALAAGDLRTGFREIAWTRAGLRINGRHQRLIGLNRHELFPYVGFAASDRVQRNDARILKEDLGIDIVRCSHYPPSEAFLDACDELGLLVFEETPGWQYAGTAQRDPVYADPWQPVPLSDRDPGFEQAHIDQLRRMIERDRHRPSVVIWGAFLNETRAFTPDLWEAVAAQARALDPGRPLGGATRYRRNGHEDGLFDSAHDALGRKVWPFDVFGYNDYHLGADDMPDFLPPVTDYPYLVTEAIGQLPRFRAWFTRGERSAGLSRQALYHGTAIELAFADDIAGVIGWVAFDYPSPHGAPWEAGHPALGRRGHALKTPGVLDIFRIPKPAAALYRAQRSPQERIVLDAAFAWDDDVHDTEPLRFASNCEELLVAVDDGEPARVLPDRGSFPRTPHPFFVLERPVAGTELHVRGRIGGRDVAELHMTRDSSGDRLQVQVDDTRIDGDGVDSTRVAFQVTDGFGNLRATAAGAVSVQVAGPGVLIGPGLLDVPASAGAVWVRSVPGAEGTILVHLSHPTAGSGTASVAVGTTS